MNLRALLVVDRRFLERDGCLFTEGPIGSETGESYLQHFEEVVVAGRPMYDKGQDIKLLNRVDRLGLHVEFLPDISGLMKRARNIKKARLKLTTLMSQSDAVIARLPTELGLEAANIAIARQKPLALDLGGCVLDGLRTHGSIAGKVYAPFAYLRLRHTVRRAEWIAYVTQQFLQKRYPASPDSHVVAASDVLVFEYPEDELQQQRIACINYDRPLVFGTVGSLSGNFKGIHVAFAALRRAMPRLPAFTYRILGGGDSARWLNLARRSGLSDLVIFDGTLPAGEEVLNWLDGIDIYLQPSLREGLPRALIEAMSRGCPALASNIAGLPELLPPEYLHRPGDFRMLSDQIVRMVDPKCRQICSRQNWLRTLEYREGLNINRRNAFWDSFRLAVRRHTNQLQ